jgi:hypothetical protein
MSVNMWIEYVKSYSEKKGLSYKEGMKEASSSYNRLKEKTGGGKEKEKKKECEGCKYNSAGQRDHMGPGGCLEENSNNNVNNNNNNNKKKKKECEGCKYNSAGQRDHMGPGGCLEEN